MNDNLRYGRFDMAQVCLNGHVVNGMAKTYPQHNKLKCSFCDAPTITHCPHCKEEIRGCDVQAVPSRFEAPQYCIDCGEKFPWSNARTATGDGTLGEWSSSPKPTRRGAILYSEKLRGLQFHCSMPKCTEMETTTGWLYYSLGSVVAGVECPLDGEGARLNGPLSRIVEEVLAEKAREGFDIKAAMRRAAADYDRPSEPAHYATVSSPGWLRQLLKFVKMAVNQFASFWSLVHNRHPKGK